jgi:predicted helicase
MTKRWNRKPNGWKASTSRCRCAAGIDNAEGKQRIVVELYEKFFRVGFPRTAKALGIVYTPTQIVDFVLRAANDALHAEFGTTLSQPDVHILGTGTGTFIVRLIQTGLIDPKDLARRYSSELHADEIVLLAYYIAAINVEAAYHGVAGGDYQPFDGMVLTDTFQITEAGDTMDAELFPQNNDRIIAQQASPIRVIVGNRPTSRASPAPTTTTPTAKDPDLTVEDAVDYDDTKISWLSGLLPKVQRGQHLTYQPNHRRMAMYRPFCKMHVYFDADLNDRRGRLHHLFPRADLPNFGFFAPNPGNLAPPFLCLMTDALADLGAAGISAVNVYPRWTYQPIDPSDGQLSLDGDGDTHTGYRRIDTISTDVLGAYRGALGDDITADETFFYIYGLLHSPHYRRRFATDLKKVLPRIPTAADREKFDAFTHAGRTQRAAPGLRDRRTLPAGRNRDRHPQPRRPRHLARQQDAVQVQDRSQRPDLKLPQHPVGHPRRRAPKPTRRPQRALEWVIERYQTKADSKGSGIVNDPNAWCDEHNDPRYIIDLIKRIVTVSITTMSIVDGLPELHAPAALSTSH